MKKYALLLLFMLGVTLNSEAQSRSEATCRFFEKNYILEEDGTVKERTRITLTLNTHTSFNSLFGETFIRYNPEYQTVTINECYTIMEDGTKVMTPENAMNEMLPKAASDAPAYTHLREIVITHTALEVGAEIHIDYTIETKPELTNGELDAVVTFQQMGFEIFWGNITVKLPKDKKLRWASSDSKVQPSFGRDSTYRWSFMRQEQLENEPYAAKYNGKTRLYISTMPLETVMATMGRTTRDQVRLDPEKMSAAKNETEKFNLIAKHIESMVELCDIQPASLMNYRHHAPSEVDRRGYGTKADKAFLFDRLLTGEGFASDILVSYPIDCKEPNLSGYDDLYVKVTINGEDKFYNVNGKAVNVEFIADRYKFYSLKSGSEVAVEFKKNEGTYVADITVKGDELDIKAEKNGQKVENVAAKLVDCGSLKMLELPKSGLTDWGVKGIYSKRISPIELPSQLSVNEQYKVSVRDGKVVTPNREIKIDNKVGTLEIRVETSGHTVKIERKLDMKGSIVSKGNIQDFREIANAWNDENLLKLMLTK